MYGGWSASLLCLLWIMVVVNCGACPMWLQQLLLPETRANGPSMKSGICPPLHHLNPLGLLQTGQGLWLWLTFGPV